MINQIKTPGDYINEITPSGSNTVSNGTAVPVFIGFTELALGSQNAPLNKVNGATIVHEPFLVQSMLEYQGAFGGADTTGTIYVSEVPNVDGQPVYSAQNFNADGTALYDPGLMYPSVSNFFSNGGLQCYIVSIGLYADFSPSMASTITSEMPSILRAIQTASAATLILPTDLIRFGTTNYYNWATQLTNFSAKEKMFFTVLDVIQGAPNSSIFDDQDITNYRNGVVPNSESSSYVGAYFPYLKSLTPYAYKSDLSNVYLDDVVLTNSDNATIEAVETFLATNYINMPPSPFMAGIYSSVDSANGVWTPPANVAPIGVTGPLVPLTNSQQEDLNEDPTTGKSINAIRYLTGRGTIVWGARTNDGNSMDWRYINVRRLFISMETAINIAYQAYVFSPNDSNTWVTVKSEIVDYLTGLCLQGAFAGKTTEKSFQVLIGLGVTMTSQDVLDGRMLLSVLVAPLRPDEFIELKFTLNLES